MRTLSPERWQIISPYLDQALAMTDDALAVWLSSLRPQNPGLAAELAALLDEHRMLAQEGFLEKGSPCGRVRQALRAKPLAPTHSSLRSAKVEWEASGSPNAVMAGSSGVWL